MPQRVNIILFVLISAGILGGWFFLTQFDKSDEKPEIDPKVLEAKEKAAKDKMEKDKLVKAKEAEERAAREKAVKEQEAKNNEIKKVSVKEEPIRTETLGGDGFHLTVDTISRGAGVRKVTLNRFQKADWQGRPVFTGEGQDRTPVALELIQDDEHAPSFRMYHYLQPKDEFPVFGLGEAIWKFEGRKKITSTTRDAEAVPEELSYSTTVTGFDDKIKIIKTYRLAPKDYHVTMLLEIHDTRTERDGPPILFRYQLTGAQGLPIEGEWYTATFRNGMMGLVDRGDNLWRKLEDSGRISHRLGGDTWPDDKYRRGDNRLQYAGVVNQFFGVMIVVDDVQPLKDNGGIDQDKILAWARPTLETRERRGKIIAINDDSIIFRDADSITAGERLDKLAREQTKLRAETKEGLSEKLVTAQKELAKRAEDVRKMNLPHQERVGPALTTAVELLKKAAANIDGGKGEAAVAEQAQAIEKLMVARDALTKPGHYVLLPRTKKHLEDLKIDLEDDPRAVLSSYDTPDGKSIATWVRLGETLKPQFDDITVRVNSEVVELHPGSVQKHQFMLYHGPVKAALLAQFTGDEEVPGTLVDRYTHTLHLRTLTDYHSDNWFGWASSKIGLTWLIIQFTRLMHWLLNYLHYVFGYGLSILVLTIMVRGAMFPISRKQAMFSIKMQELAPELKKITEKYADDPTAKMQATQEFYRKHGINPLGSCWPVFLQMPIFLGLYFAFQESIHFRLAPFLWIQSLAAPDMVLRWGESIPVISSPDSATGILGILYLGPYLNILPIFAVLFMVVVQMQTMPPPTDEQQAMQQKMLKYMSIFFGLMFYKVAAGLCIYFIASSVWGICERKLLPKKKSAAEYPGAAPVASGSVASSTAKGTLIPKSKGKWEKKDKAKETNKEPVTALEKLKALWHDILKKAEKK